MSDSIRATYYDRDGEKIGESVEDDAPTTLCRRPKRVETPQVQFWDVFWANKGTKRRPSLADREGSARFGLTAED